MRSIKTNVIVEWEDCDPAGIVYYPRFLAYFDRGTWNLWLSVGLTRERMRALGAVGLPIAEVQARFLYPCRFKEELRLESWVSEIQENRVTVSHELHNGGKIAVTGYEIRFLGLPHPDDPTRLRIGELPQQVLDLLRRGRG